MFQQEPPQRKERHNLQIIRTEARGKSGGVILSAKMFGLPIHFYGRSIPCTQDHTCPICQAGNDARWTGYLPVWTPKMIKPGLLELPTAASEQVEEYQHKYATLRGRVISATRPRGRANSKIKIDIASPSTEGLNIPPVPDVREALCLIWQLDFDDMENSLREKMTNFERYKEQQVQSNGHKPSSNL